MGKIKVKVKTEFFLLANVVNLRLQFKTLRVSRHKSG